MILLIAGLIAFCLVQALTWPPFTLSLIIIGGKPLDAKSSMGDSTVSHRGPLADRCLVEVP